MPVKTTMRYDCTPGRFAKIKQSVKCWPRCEATGAKSKTVTLESRRGLSRTPCDPAATLNTLKASARLRTRTCAGTLKAAPWTVAGPGATRAATGCRMRQNTPQSGKCHVDQVQNHNFLQKTSLKSEMWPETGRKQSRHSTHKSVRKKLVKWLQEAKMRDKDIPGKQMQWEGRNKAESSGNTGVKLPSGSGRGE